MIDNTSKMKLEKGIEPIRMALASAGCWDRDTPGPFPPQKKDTHDSRKTDKHELSVLNVVSYSFCHNMPVCP
jgi:hypothetical protein